MTKREYNDHRGTKQAGAEERPNPVFSSEEYFRKITCSTAHQGKACPNCGAPAFVEYFRSIGPDGATQFKRVERCRRLKAIGATRCNPQTRIVPEQEYQERTRVSQLECPNRKTSYGSRMVPKAYGIGVDPGGRR